MGRIRWVNLMAAVWGLFIVPTLCTGGLIVHQCEDEHPSPCHPTQEKEDTSGCGHESDCSDDPCHIVGLRGFARQDQQPITSFAGLTVSTLSPVYVGLGFALAVETFSPVSQYDPHISHAVETTVLLI